MSNQSLLVIIVVGIVAGWLAGQIMRGAGYGIIGDLIVGIVGAYIGDWLLPRLGIHLGTGIIAAIIDATIGALVLLFILRLVFGGAAGEAGDGVGEPREANSKVSCSASLSRGLAGFAIGDLYDSPSEENSSDAGKASFPAISWTAASLASGRIHICAC